MFEKMTNEEFGQLMAGYHQALQRKFAKLKAKHDEGDNRLGKYDGLASTRADDNALADARKIAAEARADEAVEEIPDDEDEEPDMQLSREPILEQEAKPTKAAKEISPELKKQYERAQEYLEQRDQLRVHEHFQELSESSPDELKAISPELEERYREIQENIERRDRLMRTSRERNYDLER